MLKVGLTGGYATGKSFVAAELERLGCKLIYADRLGHSVLLPGGEAYEPTLQMFGTADRRKLAEIVFASPDLLAKLTAVVHPAVFRLEEEMLREIASKDPHAIAVIEAAILIESGRTGVFDRLILTTCDEETQISRGMSRDRITRSETLSRIVRQMPFEQKKPFAHYIVDTSGSKDETLRQVNQIFAEIKSFDR